MNTPNQLQLDYPAWRLSFREYGELKGYTLDQTEATTQVYDETCIYCGKDAETCEHYEEPLHIEPDYEPEQKYGSHHDFR